MITVQKYKRIRLMSIIAKNMNKLVNFGVETECYKWILSLKNKIKNTQIKTDRKLILYY